MTSLPPRQASLSHGDFEVFEDEHGRAALPLSQTLVLRTTAHAAVVSYRSHLADYVRLGVPYEAPDPAGGTETVTRVISDFRASFSDAYIVVARRPLQEEERGRLSPGTGKSRFTGPPALAEQARALLPTEYGDVIFEGWAPHNALEFAYQAPYEFAS